MSTHECPECGDEFESNRGLGIHRGRSHDLPYKDEEVLHRLYHKEGLSQTEIGDKFDVESHTIAYWMDELDVDANMKYYDPSYPPHHHFFNPQDGDVGFEYERVSTQVDGTLYTFPIHRLIGVAIGGIEPSEFFDWDVVIHHKSGHGLDNRHDNLERMKRGEHTSHHEPWEWVGGK